MTVAVDGAKLTLDGTVDNATDAELVEHFAAKVLLVEVESSLS